MKRSLVKTIAIVILMIATVFPASAERQMSLSNSVSSETSRREAFEFYGLYIKRRMELCDYLKISSETYAATLGNIAFSALSSSEMTVETPAGSITFRLSDHTVSEVTDGFYYLSQTTEKNKEHLINALAIISALEYESLEEIQDSFARKSGISFPPSAVEKIVSLYNKEISDNINEALLEASTKETLVYSGNYNYYIEFYAYSDDEKMYFLIARAR